MKKWLAVLLCLLLIGCGESLMPGDPFVSPLYSTYAPNAIKSICPDRGGRWGVNLQEGDCGMLIRLCADWYINNLGVDNQWPEGTCPGYTWGKTHLPYFAYHQFVRRWNERGWDNGIPPARLGFGNEWDGYWPMSPTDAVAMFTPVLESVLDAGGLVIGPFPAYSMEYAREFWQEFERQNGYLPPHDQVQLGIHCYEGVDACRQKIIDALAIHVDLFGTPLDAHGLPYEPVALWGEYGSLIWGGEQDLAEAVALDRDLANMALTEPESRILAGIGYYSLAHRASDNVPCGDMYHCFKTAHWPYYDNTGQIERWNPVPEVADYLRAHTPAATATIPPTNTPGWLTRWPPQIAGTPEP